jgi:hypothetical protein
MMNLQIFHDLAIFCDHPIGTRPKIQANTKKEKRNCYCLSLNTLFSCSDTLIKVVRLLSSLR